MKTYKNLLIQAVLILSLTSILFTACKKNDDVNDENPDPNPTSNIPTDGLIIFFPFTGNAIDQSGFGNNGTVNGAILSPDRFGNQNAAYYFTGGDFITAPKNMLPIGNNPRSVSLWVKTDGNLDSDVPVCWGDNSTNKGYGIAMGTAFGNPKGFKHFGWANDISISYNYPNDQWFHITGTYDGDTAIFYVNGNEIKRGNKSWDTGQHYFLIGKNLNDNSNDHFNGDIDEIRIYNRELNPQEVNTIYQEESSN